MFVPNVTPVTLVQPHVTTNARDDTVYDYGAAATRTTRAGWIQQRSVQSIGSSRNIIKDGRNQGISQWSFYTNDGGGITRFSRLEFAGKQFIIDGEPNDTRSLAPGIDHWEFNLRLVEG